jgi:hypothetical protein
MLGSLSILLFKMPYLVFPLFFMILGGYHKNKVRITSLEDGGIPMEVPPLEGPVLWE